LPKTAWLQNGQNGNENGCLIALSRSAFAAKGVALRFRLINRLSPIYIQRAIKCSWKIGPNKGLSTKKWPETNPYFKGKTMGKSWEGGMVFWAWDY